MHKDPIGKQFIVASKKCSAKLTLKAVFKAFTLIYNHIQSFHDKSDFYSPSKQFWAIHNSKHILKKLKRLIAKLMQELFQHLTFPNFILNKLILI